MNQNQQNGQQQPGQRNWNEVSGASNNQQWTPEATEQNGFSYNPNDPPSIEGYYVKDRQLPSSFQPGQYFTVSEIQTVNPADGSFGLAFDVAQNVVLKDRLEGIKLGSYIKIVYKGKQLKKGLPPQPWSKTNSFHIWEVYEDTSAVNLNTVLGKQIPTPAAQQALPAAQQQFQQPQGQQQFNQVPATQNPVQQFHNQQQPAPGQFGQQHPAQNQQFQQPAQQQFSQGTGQFQQPAQQNPAPQVNVNPASGQQFGNQPFNPVQQNPPAAQQQFQQPQVQQQIQQPVQGNQGGVHFGGEVIKGNPFAPNGDLPF